MAHISVVRFCAAMWSPTERKGSSGEENLSNERARIARDDESLSGTGGHIGSDGRKDCDEA